MIQGAEKGRPDGRILFGLIRKMIAKSGLTVYANPMHLGCQGGDWLDRSEYGWWRMDDLLVRIRI